MALARVAERPLLNQRKYVTALARGLEVLRCFGLRDLWLGNQEIAARTRLARPTVTRLTYTLVRTGHLRYSRTNNKYALGCASRSLGFASLAQMDFRCAARPLMEKLSEHARGTVGLSVRDGDSMVLIDSYQHWPTPAPVDIGSRVPMPTTAIGRAYLFALPREQRRELMDELKRADPLGWPSTRKALDAAASAFAKDGFSFSAGEWRRDVIAVAVPLLVPGAPEPVVFSVSGAFFELEPEPMRREIAPRLLALAGNVCSALDREGIRP